MNNKFQAKRATLQSKNRCQMVSSKPHKLHLESPFHFLFIKLSFANTTPLFKYHRKILIFKGIFAFQKISFPPILSSFINSLYNDWVE